MRLSHISETPQSINTKTNLLTTQMPNTPEPTLGSSWSMSKKAWMDLESLGYDINALKRMNMNDNQVVELRDKAFRYRGLKVPERENNNSLF